VQSAVARDYGHADDPDDGHRQRPTWRRSIEGHPVLCIGPAADFEDTLKGFAAHSDQERLLENGTHRFVRFSWVSWLGWPGPGEVARGIIAAADAREKWNATPLIARLILLMVG